MTFLPPPPLKHLANPKTKKTHITKSYTGIAAFTKLFEKAEDKPPKVVQENQPERRKRLKSEQKASTSMFLKIEKEAYQRVFDPKKSKDNTPRDETINMLTSEIPSNMNMNIDVGALFNSAVDKFQLQKRKVAMNPYNTLFVGRLHYSITDTKLLREFDSFGKVNDIILVSDPYKKAESESESDPAQIQAATNGNGKGKGKGRGKKRGRDDAQQSQNENDSQLQINNNNNNTSNSRGYAFIEYTSEADMRNAFNRSDGRRLEGKPIVVDVQRAGTVPDWTPRKLGGGIGCTRIGPKQMNIHMPGRLDGRFVQSRGFTMNGMTVDGGDVMNMNDNRGGRGMRGYREEERR
ncbi:hypothetical protein ScalyP_jg2720 [Parmales sp. scaly parma]|nr:hypothetical protein ScalyP_jg2720 [Parmales sp. scaly parma]